MKRLKMGTQNRRKTLRALFKAWFDQNVVERDDGMIVSSVGTKKFNEFLSRREITKVSSDSWGRLMGSLLRQRGIPAKAVTMRTCGGVRRVVGGVTL